MVSVSPIWTKTVANSFVLEDIVTEGGRHALNTVQIRSAHTAEVGACLANHCVVVWVELVWAGRQAVRVERIEVRCRGLALHASGGVDADRAIACHTSRVVQVSVHRIGEDTAAQALEIMQN